MKLNPAQMRLYAVTDRAWAADTAALLAQVEAAIDGGAGIVQLREKHLSEAELLPIAQQFTALCRRRGVVSIINDSAAVAAQVGADGVHVGQSDLAAAQARAILEQGRIVGVSAHNVEEARRAQAAGADYLGVGAAFVTGTKADARPIGRDTIRAITRAVDIPVVAIGGITRENLPELAGCGVDGVAVVSALFAQPDVKAAAQALLPVIDGIARPAGLRGAIFDLDGTLTDSSHVWEEAPAALLRRRGITPPPDLGATLKTMGARQGAEYVRAQFGLQAEPEALLADVCALAEEEYRLRVPAKPGAARLLARLAAQGVPCCVATANEAGLTRAALERLGLLPYLEDVVSCFEQGDKNGPAIYREAAHRLGVDPARTVVFEDALHAARAAKAGGFRVCAVYDAASAGDWPALQALADWAVHDLADWRP